MMLPSFLYHYYREFPFLTLSDLSPAEVDELVGQLAEQRSLPFRLKQTQYMPYRRKVEQQVRLAFIQKGGRPTRENPHYMILGRSPHWEELEPHVVVVPLTKFSSDKISFTYTDSFYTFSDSTLHGRSIPKTPHHRTVYRMGDIHDVVRQYGMPPGYTDPNEEFDVYIEAQIWDDVPLQNYLRAKPERRAV